MSLQNAEMFPARFVSRAFRLKHVRQKGADSATLNEMSN